MLVFAAVRAAPIPAAATRPVNTPAAGAAEDASAALAPRFEPNVGQAGEQVRFLSRGQGYTMLMTGTGAVLRLGRPAGRAAGAAGTSSGKGAEAVVGLTFEGANPDPVVAGHGRLAGVSNYLLGSDPDGWLTGVPNYSRVTYRGLYEGVDLDWYANRAGELEFDLTLAPGVDPAGIRLFYTGAERLVVDGSGALVLHTGASQLRQAPPVVYQQVDGARREVRGRYVLHGSHRVGFALTGYDTSLPLVIDPVISYSTYLGGSGDDNPIWSDIDRAGNVHVEGDTGSPDFPTTPGSFQPTFGGGDGDGFVVKLRPGGGRLVYSTFVGGPAPTVPTTGSWTRRAASTSTASPTPPTSPSSRGRSSRPTAAGRTTPGWPS